MTSSVPHCQSCKTTDESVLHVQSRGKNGAINRMCRKCTTERAKKYRHTPDGAKSVYGSVVKFQKKNKHKVSAWHKVRNHLPKLKGKCALCDAPAEVRHHEDYSKPLEVVSLCACCHVRLHLGKIALTPSP